MHKPTLAALLALATLVTSPAFAASTWIGNAYVHHDRRGMRYDADVGNTPLHINIASYDRLSVHFEFYKAGVTNGGGEVWKQVDAKAVIVQENGEIIGGGSAMIEGQRGNNALYSVDYDSLMPKNKLPKAHSETISANLDILIDGERRLSIPIDYVYEP